MRKYLLSLHLNKDDKEPPCWVPLPASLWTLVRGEDQKVPEKATDLRVGYNPPNLKKVQRHTLSSIITSLGPHNFHPDKKPSKLVVVPGAVLGQLKVHLLREDGKPKLIRVQLQLQVTPDDDIGDVDDDDAAADDGSVTLRQGERRS